MPSENVLGVSHGISLRFFFIDSMLVEGFGGRDVDRPSADLQLRLSICELDEPRRPARPRRRRRCATRLQPLGTPYPV